MHETLQRILQNLEVVNGATVQREARREASEWLSRFQQKEPQAGVLCFEFMKQAVGEGRSMTPPGADSPAAPLSPLFHALRGSPLELPVLLFFAQTMTLKTKQVLVRPRELREASREPWMAPEVLWDLAAAFSVPAVKKTLQSCLGHSIVIEMIVGDVNKVSNILRNSVQAAQDVCAHILSAAQNGVWDNVTRMISAEGDYQLIRCVAESLKIQSKDPDGKLRVLPITLATQICDTNLIAILKLSVQQPVFLKISELIIDHIETIEELCRAWQSMTQTDPLPEQDHMILKEHYKTLCSFQRLLMEILLELPQTLFTFDSYIHRLAASAVSLTAPCNSKVRKDLMRLKSRPAAAAPTPQDSVTLAYALANLILVAEHGTEAVVQLHTSAVASPAKVVSQLQLARSVMELSLGGAGFQGILERWAQQDQKNTDYEKQVLEVSLKAFLNEGEAPSANHDWRLLARIYEDPSTPAELAAVTYTTLADFSEDEDDDDSLGEDESITDPWQALETLCGASLAAYIRWIASVVHTVGPIIGFGALCAINESSDVDVGPLFTDVFYRFCRIPLLTPMPELSLHSGHIAQLMQLGILYGMPHPALTVPLGSSLQIQDKNAPLTQFKTGATVMAGTKCLLDYEYACSTLNDSFQNAFRDFGEPMAKQKLVSEKMASHELLFEHLFDCAFHSTIYPLNFASASPKLKRMFCNHREDVRANLRSWVSLIGDHDVMWRMYEKTADEMLRETNWRTVECVVQIAAYIANYVPHQAITLLDLPIITQKATEHRAVLRQYMALVSALAPIPEAHSEQFMHMALRLCRASFRVPQTDPCYPLASKRDHMGCVTLSRLLSFLPEQDSALLATTFSAMTEQVVRELHEDAIFIATQCKDRSLTHSVKPAQHIRCFASIKSLPGFAYCCAKYLMLASKVPRRSVPPSPTPGNGMDPSAAVGDFHMLNISQAFINRLTELIVEVMPPVRHDLGEEVPMKRSAVPDREALLLMCASSLIEALTVYVAEILPAGLKPALNVNKEAGILYDMTLTFGGPHTPEAFAGGEAVELCIARARPLCQVYGRISSAAEAHLSVGGDTVYNAMQLLTNAMLSSGIVLDTDSVGQVLQAISRSPLLSCVDSYLRALKTVALQGKQTGVSELAELDAMLGARLKQLLTGNTGCTLATVPELGMHCEAVIKVIRSRFELFPDETPPVSGLKQIVTVAMLSIVCYTHSLYRTVVESPMCPTASLTLMIEVCERLATQNELDTSLDDKAVYQVFHAIVADTQLRAATKGSARSSRDSIASVPPTPVPLMQMATPRPAQTTATVGVLSTVALMTLITAQDFCPSISGNEVHRSLDLAPRILTSAARVTAAAKYLAGALPFDGEGVELPASPYKWACSEESIKHFVEAVAKTQEQHWRKTLKGQCALLNVAKRRGTRNSLVPQ